MSAGLLVDVHLVTLSGPEDGTIADGAIAWSEGRITWLGPGRELPADYVDVPQLEGEGGWVTPGLIDCHTHIVYGGNRSHEFAARLAGERYEAIAQRGGGIAETVRATRSASEAQLLAESLPRVDALLAEGVTTLEVKSGYGLDLVSERRMLDVARRIATLRPLRIRTTFLGAHALPPEFAGRSDDYIDYLCNDVLAVLHAEGLVDAVDAFCDTIGFTPLQVERLFATAGQLGLPVRLHAEQLSNQHGAALAARHQALSADHLEWLDDAGVAALARAGTVAVLLPGAYYFLRETRTPPIAKLRNAGVPLAVATDCNPGSSLLTSLLTAMNMSCVLFGLTPAEALAGVTREAARALGLHHDTGTLAVGKRADLALWRIARPADLCYMLGANPLARCWCEGVERRL